MKPDLSPTANGRKPDPRVTVIGVDCWPASGPRFERVYFAVKDYYRDYHQLANPRPLARKFHEDVAYCFYVVLVFASRYGIKVKEMTPNHEYYYIRASKRL